MNVITIFEQHFKLICILGEAKDVIIVTKQGFFYAFGPNKTGCLGSGESGPVTKPKEAKELSNKQIIYISCGLDFVIALTNAGKCYSWGSNSCGQLGTDSQDSDSPTKMITSLSDKVITKISCNHKHCLVLTESGEVLGFGHNIYEKSSKTYLTYLLNKLFKISKNRN